MKLQQLKSLARALRKAPRVPITLERRRWCPNAPEDAGVYAIWDNRNDRPVYVGETAHLQERFDDLRRTVNHTFRRRLKKKLEQQRRRVITESDLTKHISNRYALSWIAVDIGRKELEEYLICVWSTDAFNKAPSRHMRSQWYLDNLDRMLPA